MSAAPVSPGPSTPVTSRDGYRSLYSTARRNANAALASDADLAAARAARYANSPGLTEPPSVTRARGLIFGPSRSRRDARTASLAELLSEEQVHGPLETHFKRETHTNLFEHASTPFVFVLRIFLFGLLGILAGAAIEKLVDLIPNDGQSSGRCFGLLLLQLLIIGLVILVGSLFVGRIDELIMDTWSGFLFGVTFFVAQSSLTKNAQCSFGIPP